MLMLPHRWWENLIILNTKIQSELHILYLKNLDVEPFEGIFISYKNTSEIKLRSKFSRVSCTIWPKIGLTRSFFTPLKRRCGKALQVCPWCRRSKSNPNLQSTNPNFEVWLQIYTNYFYQKRGLQCIQTSFQAVI